MGSDPVQENPSLFFCAARVNYQQSQNDAAAVSIHSGRLIR
jgi:hypothetical protein